ncbi:MULTISPECIES: preprotein translocase subunit YajC [Leeia]|uniref:Sec translocon accessory complex subunit YajC n=1 Tax=Leeia aquatica TaxID=2725557 RepID=A0A847S524_9NEIS|nr:preprotein translocase subunit YajC [Leeia aquatica]NLR74924.1 preprotein translocase subunit YajC [Leeia aquatica]
MWISPAHAAPAAAAAPSMIEQFLPMVVIFVAFYFFLIRPQQKKAKALREQLSQLKKGDEVLTNGGVAGRINKLADDYITIETAGNTQLLIQRAAIAAVLPKGTLSL